VNNGGNVLEKPSIVYGGINPQFVSIIIVAAATTKTTTTTTTTTMTTTMTMTMTTHVECESKSDTSNTRCDWNHFKITQKVP